jgi:hypothetical protein
MIHRIALLILFGVQVISFAQDQSNPASTATPDQNTGQYQYYTKEQPKKIRSRLYLGIGSGINNYVGIIGPNAEFRLSKKVGISAIAGVGLGSWGYKVSTGFRFYFKYPLKFAFNIGYSYATGLPELSTQLDYYDLNGKLVTKNNVRIALNGVHLINFSFLYFFRMGDNNRFSIEAGYSVGLKSGNNFTVLDNGVRQLTKESIKVLNFIEPGGVILGINFYFGVF